MFAYTKWYAWMLEGELHNLLWFASFSIIFCKSLKLEHNWYFLKNITFEHHWQDNCIISNDPPCKDSNGRLTTIPLKPLFDQVWIS